MMHLTIDCILIQWKTVKSPCTQGTSSSVWPWPSSTCGFLHQQCPYLSFPVCAMRNLTETFPWNFSTPTDVWGASLAHSRCEWPSERWAFPLPWLDCPSRCSPQKICCSLSSPSHPAGCWHCSLPWAQTSEHKLFLKGEASTGQPRDSALLPVPPAPPTTNSQTHTQLELHGLEPGQKHFLKHRKGRGHRKHWPASRF